jgi:four helix bundle protein
MSRDHRKLGVFGMADELVLPVYRLTAGFPPEERFGLKSQLRRSAISVATNIVEGCTRRTRKDYLRFLEVALGSACETRYLIGIAHRLGLVSKLEHDAIEPRYGELVRGLQALSNALDDRSVAIAVARSL